jgi:2-methylcitrate dehydratase PrpD
MEALNLVRGLDMDIMEPLVKNIASTQFKSLPPEAILASKKGIADTIGVMIAGSSVEGCQILVDHLKEWGGHKESTIAVFGEKAPCNLAAQANGAMARALEIDDVTDIFPLHPSASIVPTCLAIAERRGKVTGIELITAIALAQDLIIRMALANKLDPIESGRYNLFKIFPPTAAAGKLLGLDEKKLMNAMGIAYSQMVGDGQAAGEGVMTSYIQQGTVAKSAIESALLAQAGITGTKNVLQGPRGFYNAIEPEPDLEALTSGLGEKFMGVEIAVKFYTACRAAHEAIDLALDMTGHEDFDPDQIDEILVKVNEPVYNLVCQPLDRKRHPETLVDAQFSLPFTVASAIIRGDFFISELSDEAIKDPDIMRLTQKVTPIVDSKCHNELVIGSAIMEIKTKNGQTYSKEIQFPRGNPKNPVSMNEVIEKFQKCVNYSIKPFSKENIDKLVDLLYKLEQLEDVTQLTQLLCPNSQ